MTGLNNLNIKYIFDIFKKINTHERRFQQR